MYIFAAFRGVVVMEILDRKGIVGVLLLCKDPLNVR